MRNRSLFGLGLGLLFAAVVAAGCNSEADSRKAPELDRVLKLLDELHKALEQVSDSASAEDAAAEIDKICDRWGELMKESPEAARLLQQADKPVQNSYREKFEAARRQIETAVQRAGAKSGDNRALETALARLASLESPKVEPPPEASQSDSPEPAGG